MFISFLAGLSLLVTSLAYGKTLNVVITVDWEGREISETNLRAMEDLREDFQNIPFTHYLNAAYYTKAHANPRSITRKIRRVVGDLDEHGLHIHAWKSLVLRSDVSFQKEPTFTNSIADCSTALDCGHGVPLSLYSEEELGKLVQTSKSILINQGFREPVSFRSGGWMSNSNVTQVLIDHGFISDSSDVAAFFVLRYWRDYNLGTWIDDLWGNTTMTSQPYVQQKSNGAIWQIIDNGALADYINGHEMWNVAEENLAILRAVANEESQRFVVIGFHVESANRYIGRIRRLLEYIETYTGNNPEIGIEFITANEATLLLQQGGV